MHPSAQSPPLVDTAPPARRRATESELCALEDEYDAYAAWAAANDLPSTAGLYWAWAGLRDLGVDELGRSGGAPW
jgi:hypothetical protein